jgi:hypothetical protein
MFTLSEAAELARRATGREVDVDRAQETVEGWFFPYDRSDMLGSNGVVINKTSGKALVLGSAFTVARDLALYDKGYQFDAYDLVVLGFSALDAAVESLSSLNLTKVIPEYSSGVMWRIPKPLTREDIRARLSALPAVFGAAKLYFVLEKLHRAREAGILQVDILEYGVAQQAVTADEDQRAPEAPADPCS